MERSEFKDPEAKPTGRQVYALAAALCRHIGESFPTTRYAASELIDRLRADRGEIEEPTGEAPMP